MDYKEMLDDILELDDNFIIIVGYADIEKTDNYHFKNLTSDNFWRIIGKIGDDDTILESLEECECEVEMEGEYEFKSVLRWIPGDYDEYGRCTMRDYLEIKHIEFNFIQTFIERERESKLNEIFSDDLNDDFFNLL